MKTGNKSQLKGIETMRKKEDGYRLVAGPRTPDVKLACELRHCLLIAIEHIAGLDRGYKSKYWEGRKERKEPWEMSKEEFDSQYQTEEARKTFSEIQHRDAVMGALFEGKKVPQYNIDRYPGLTEYVSKESKRLKENEAKKSAQDEELRKLSEQRQEEDAQKKLVEEETIFNALINTPLAERIKRSGYKTNRQGVHDLLREEQSEAIQQAISEGKTPYEGWEKDYPDLAPKATDKESLTVEKAEKKLDDFGERGKL
jgi:hypothetical protein